MTARFHDAAARADGRAGERMAFYAGSFNPFTIGHLSIVERGLEIFDRIIIGVGYNISKAGGREEAENRVAEIAPLFNGRPEVTVVAYDGLTVDAARRFGAVALLRGVRGCADFENERNLADVNRRIGGLETVILFTLPEHAYISSSVVRELRHFGHDVSQFIPDSSEEK